MGKSCEQRLITKVHIRSNAYKFNSFVLMQVYLFIIYFNIMYMTQKEYCRTY